MARGRLFSRKYEPAKPRSPQELEKSPNPLIQLGLAFKRLQKLGPEAQPNPVSGVEDGVDSRRPLVDINDVRKYLREKLAITKEVATIPLPNPSPVHHADAHLHSRDDETNPSETTQMSSKHSYSSDASSLPTHSAAPGTRPFDIGTVGHSILEANELRRTISSSSAGPDQPEVREPARRASFKPPDRQPTTTTLEVSDMEQEATTRFEVNESGTQQPSTIILEVNEASRRAPSSAGQEQSTTTTTYTWIVEPPASDAAGLPQVDMKDVQEFVRVVVEVYKRVENWGLPETSWENKMPWHSPPPRILTRGLQRPPQSFASEGGEVGVQSPGQKAEGVSDRVPSNMVVHDCQSSSHRIPCFQSSRLNNMNLVFHLSLVFPGYQSYPKSQLNEESLSKIEGISSMEESNAVLHEFVRQPDGWLSSLHHQYGVE